MDDEKQKKIIAQNLNYYLKANDLQQKDIAKVLGVKPATFSTWCTGQSMPNVSRLQTIAAYLGLDLTDLTEEHKDRLHPGKKGVKIPVLGEVAAGIPIEEIEDIIDYEDINADLASTGKFFGLKIKGNSMEPMIHDGSVVIVKSQPDCNSGDIAIVSVENEFGACKKVVKNEMGIQLVSLNPAYDPVFFTNKQITALPIKIIGKVVETRLKI